MSDINRVAAQLAAALRSGNSQASESALRQYEALEVDESDLVLDLSPAKRVLAEEAEEAEVETEEYATPAARKLAEDEGVDLGSVTGSGVGGKIVKGDVEEAQA